MRNRVKMGLCQKGVIFFLASIQWEKTPEISHFVGRIVEKCAKNRLKVGDENLAIYFWHSLTPKQLSRISGAQGV
jgi:hypothetical protein